MGSTAHPIKLVQVVGPDAMVDQLLAKLNQRLGVIVDAAKQHGLIQQWHTGVGQPLQSFEHMVVEFAGMVGMHDDPKPQADWTAADPRDRP